MINIIINENTFTIEDSESTFPIDAQSATFAKGNATYTYDSGSSYQVIKDGKGIKFIAHFNIGTDKVNGSVVDADGFKDAMNQITSGGGCEPVELNKTLTKNGTYQYSDNVYSPVNVTVDVPQDYTTSSITINKNGTYTAPENIDGYSAVTVNVPATTSAITINKNGEYTAPENIDGYSAVTVNVEGVATPVAIEKWDRGLANLQSEEYSAVIDTYNSNIVNALYNFVDLGDGTYWTAEFNGNANYVDYIENINYVWADDDWQDFSVYQVNFIDPDTGHFVYPKGTKVKFSYRNAICFYNMQLTTEAGEVVSDQNVYEGVKTIDDVQYYEMTSNYGTILIKVSDNTKYGYVNGTLYTIPDHTKFYLDCNISESNRGNNSILFSKTDGSLTRVKAIVNTLYASANDVQGEPTSAWADYLVPSRGRTPINGMIYDNAKIVNDGIHNIYYFQFEVVGGKYFLSLGDNCQAYFAKTDDATLQYCNNFRIWAMYDGCEYNPELPLVFYKNASYQTNYVIRGDSGEPFRLISESNVLTFTINSTDYHYSYDSSTWDDAGEPPATSDYYSSWSFDDNYFYCNVLPCWSNDSQIDCYIKIK